MAERLLELLAARRCVTHAHSGEKPSTCSFSFSRKLLGMKSGK